MKSASQVSRLNYLGLRKLKINDF